MSSRARDRDKERNLRGLRGALSALIDPRGRGKELSAAREEWGEYKNPIRRMLADSWEDYKDMQPDYWDEVYGVDTEYDFMQMPVEERLRRYNIALDRGVQANDFEHDRSMQELEHQNLVEQMGLDHTQQQEMLDKNADIAERLGRFAADLTAQRGGGGADVNFGGGRFYFTPEPRGSEAEPKTPSPVIGPTISDVVNQRIQSSPAYLHGYEDANMDGTPEFVRDKAVRVLKAAYEDETDVDQIDWDSIPEHELESALIMVSLGDFDSLTETAKTRVANEFASSPELDEIIDNLTIEDLQAYFPGGAAHIDFERWKKAPGNDEGEAGSGPGPVYLPQQVPHGYDGPEEREAYRLYREYMALDPSERTDIGIPRIMGERVSQPGRYRDISSVIERLKRALGK